MDRLIALLAALVGLIALAAAVLVEIHGQSERMTLTAELSALKAAIAAGPAVTQTAPTPAVATPLDDGTAEGLLALQRRVVALEAAARDNAIAVAAAALSKPAAADAPASPSAIVADGPTTDCIPLGTRFMAAAGDSYAICKTKAVVKVSDVVEGSAIVAGAGAIAAGGFGKLGFEGCTLMVFSADISGYAEMRVTCQ